MKKLLVPIYFVLLVCFVLLGTACEKRALKPNTTATGKPAPACDCAPQIPLPEPKLAEPKPTETKLSEPKPTTSATADYALLKPTNWQALDGLLNDDVSLAWPAWLQSCAGLKSKPAWQAVCSSAQTMTKPSNTAILDYFKNNFDVYSTSNTDGSNVGLITGYYEPLLKGSRNKTAKYTQALYRQPSDLITVDLTSLHPELKHKQLRGRLVGNKLVPYATREQIETVPSILAGSELVWVDDSVEAFFLQVQGSGLVKFENGEQMHVGYADQNGHAYNSIGRLLIERGELSKDQAGMQGIKNWALKNPAKLQALLNANPSYVFFRELPAGLTGPLGALGVPLTAERSVAVDAKHVPLGAPLFLSTKQPNSNKPLQRLMLAQDTGGAIKGGVRADFYWGAGDAAGKKAGSMKQAGEIWVLLPKGYPLPSQ